MTFVTLAQTLLPFIQERFGHTSVQTLDNPEELLINGVRFSVYRNSLRREITFYDLISSERETVCTYISSDGAIQSIDFSKLTNYFLLKVAKDKDT